MASEFRFLEDVAVADAAFEATGDTPAELFTAATQAVIEAMVDPGTVSTQWQRTVERREPELSDLLFDWLSELVYLKDAEGVIFHGASVTVAEEPTRASWRLQGTLSGEPIDPARHDLRADVKAVTKHLYEVRQEGTRWKARVVLDI
jgi:SHS2 domain-containing protein